MNNDKPTVAYILKGYPRISETFIINEIYLLEQMGISLRIFSVKQPNEKKSHAVVDKIKASVTYLPKTESITEGHFGLWLARHLPRFMKSHLRLLRRRPRAWMRTLFYAIFGLSFQVFLKNGARFKKSFIKEFLQAGTIADQILAEGNIGHLHGHFCHGSTTITMLASYMTGIPFSFTAHAKDIYLPKLNPNGLLQTKIADAQFVTTCTDSNRQYLEQLYPNGAPIHTIYHGLDTTLFTPPADRGDESVPTILSVGRFVEKKGFPYLVEACRLLKKRGHQFRCRIVGQSDEQTDLVKEMIREGRLEEVVQVESGVTQETLREIYTEAAIFALPCFVVDNGDRDGIPNVLAEAMAMELPIVSTDISGIPELVESGVNGLLVSQKNALALADALECLLIDATLRRRLGQAARETIIDVFDSWQTTVALRDLFNAQLDKQNELPPQTTSRHLQHVNNRPLVQAAR